MAITFNPTILKYKDATTGNYIDIAAVVNNQSEVPIVAQDIVTLEDMITETGKNLDKLTTGSMSWTTNGRWHNLTIEEDTTCPAQYYGCLSINITSYLGAGYKMLIEITNENTSVSNSNTMSICYISRNQTSWSSFYVDLTTSVIRDNNNNLHQQASYLIDLDIELQGITIDSENVYFLLATSSGANTVRKANTCSVRCTLVKNYAESIATDLIGFNPNNYYTKNNINDNYYNKITIDNMLANINTSPFSKIVCWGDSLTSGTGGNDLKPNGATALTYPDILQSLIQDNVEVINGGVGGETSWMIAARQGGQTINIAPVTIPAAAEAVSVTLLGQERNIYYNNSAYEFNEGITNYAINCGSSHGLVNPCYIGDIEGTLSRALVTAGQPDPETGETALTDTYNYYFTRTTPGEAVTLVTPTPLVTYAYKNLRNAIPIIWIGQNDKTNNVGQLNAFERAREMVNILPHNKYIVLSRPSGNDATYTDLTEKFILEFGSHYINIREWLCKYGVAYANSLGAELIISSEDQNLINAGTIPTCLRSNNSVHGNYWYYQGVAKAIYDRGKALGYWT